MKKLKIGVNNKLKGAFGETVIAKGKPTVIRINVKRHKGDKAELADTVKHELFHAKHPKASEKATQKAMPKTINQSEQARLIAKLKGGNYIQGAAKRKLGISKKDKLAPGDLINKARAMTSRARLAFMGLI